MSIVFNTFNSLLVVILICPSGLKVLGARPVSSSKTIVIRVFVLFVSVLLLCFSLLAASVLMAELVSSPLRPW